MSEISFAQNNNLIDVDFMESMSDGDHAAKEMIRQKGSIFKVLQEQYELKKPSKMPYQNTPLIPKVMHHIWDGHLSPLYQHYFEECKILHPEWEFKFWSDKDIRALNLEYEDLYQKSRNYAARSDIARYEILYRFGGVYRDVDVKCFRPIDDLNHKYEFFAPMEFPTNYWEAALNNGIIGATPKNPILKATLEEVKNRFDEYWDRFDKNEEKVIDTVPMMVAKVSMVPLINGFMKEFNDNSIALPASYFWGTSNVKYRNFKAILKDMIMGKSPSAPSAFKSIKPETLMYHNFIKEEIYRVNFDYGSFMDDPAIRRLFKLLSKSDIRKYKVFKQVYNSNYIVKSFLKQSKIPQVIHFVIFNQDESLKLNQYFDIWKLLNANFKIHIWDLDNIKHTFRNLDLVPTEEYKEEQRLFIGLKILEKFGGSYADFRVKPHRSIFELNNKYNFYAGLKHFTYHNSKVLFSPKLIGASVNHPILTSTLNKINLQDPSKINEVMVDQAYKNIYLYDDISARNIILPAIYFEPIVEFKKDKFLDRLYRFIFRIPRGFSNITEFTVVE